MLWNNLIFQNKINSAKMQVLIGKWPCTSVYHILILKFQNYCFEFESTSLNQIGANSVFLPMYLQIWFIFSEFTKFAWYFKNWERLSCRSQKFDKMISFLAWHNHVYWLLKSSHYELCGDDKHYLFFQSKRLTKRWYLLDIFELLAFNSQLFRKKQLYRKYLSGS